MYVYKNEKFWSLGEIRHKTQIIFPESEEGMQMMGIVKEQEQPTHSAPQPITDQQLAEQARHRRDRLLLESDWTDLPHARLSESEKQAWAKYRDDLFNVPQQPEFPKTIVWPVKPVKE